MLAGCPTAKARGENDGYLECAKAGQIH
jgi:hypothetical protein